jgi:hypothetical protein
VTVGCHFDRPTADSTRENATIVLFPRDWRRIRLVGMMFRGAIVEVMAVAGRDSRAVIVTAVAK